MRGMIKVVQKWSRTIDGTTRTRGRVSFPEHGVVVHVIEDGHLVHLHCKRGIQEHKQTVDLEGLDADKAGELVVERAEAAVRDLLTRPQMSAVVALGVDDVTPITR